ncbi:MAG TPA: hypothetical protein VF251_11840 [Pyrinomonadaceae bacterium]
MMRLKETPYCQGCLVPPHLLVPVRSGPSFQVISRPQCALVLRDVADELERVLEHFGQIAECDPSNRITILFKPGIFGHHRVGRAVDIYEVGNVGIDVWKRRWDEATQQALRVADARNRAAILKSERGRNLGWLLYKTLQRLGRWSQPHGYPIQLFGPWTRTEGPWQAISDFLLHAHRDHIHVAK